MDKQERDRQITRIAQFNDYQSRLAKLRQARDRVDPASIFDLEVCRVSLLYHEIGEEAIRNIRSDIRASIEREVVAMEEKVSEI